MSRPGANGAVPVFVGSSFLNKTFSPNVHSDIVQLDFSNRFSVNITQLTFAGGATDLQLALQTNTVNDHAAPGWTTINVAGFPILPLLNSEIVFPLGDAILNIDRAGKEWQFRMTSPYLRILPRVVGGPGAVVTVSAEIRRMLG